MSIRFSQKTAMLATTALLASCLPLAVATSASASSLPLAAVSDVSIANASPVDAADLLAAFDLIGSIPESVLLSGDAATAAWMAEHHPESLHSRADLLGCAGAIAWLIASTAIPAAKIVKIKRLLDTLGGEIKAVRIFWGASFSYEKIRKLGGAAAALGAELLGITAVTSKSFS